MIVMVTCIVNFSCGRYISAKTQVDAAAKVEQASKISLIGISINLSLNSILGVLFVGLSGTNNYGGVIIIALVVKLFWSAGLIYLSY